MDDKLFKILNIDKWQLLQDSLAEVTGMAIITVNYKGVPITRHSGCQPFCEHVRADKELCMYCQKCDSRGGLEATRMKRPYIYICHYNILDAAIPILVNEDYIGAIMIGQVLLDSEDSFSNLETICTLSNREKLKHQTERHDEYYSSLPKISFERVNTIVEMLFSLCNYLVDEAMGKTDFSTLDTTISYSGSSSTDLSDQHVGGILKPAFDYINKNTNKPCTLTEVAKICHVSPSYFSKLFLKETGENYSVYILRRRIELSKDLLKRTDKTITQIASELDFCDAGHFIKSFKKVEGTTPGNYRKYLL